MPVHLTVEGMLYWTVTILHVTRSYLLTWGAQLQCCGCTHLVLGVTCSCSVTMQPSLSTHALVQLSYCQPSISLLLLAACMCLSAIVVAHPPRITVSAYSITILQVITYIYYICNISNNVTIPFQLSSLSIQVQFHHPPMLHLTRLLLRLCLTDLSLHILCNKLVLSVVCLPRS